MTLATVLDLVYQLLVCATIVGLLFAAYVGYVCIFHNNQERS